MEELNKVKISVRNLVEFVMRNGDLDNRFQGNSRALDGTKIHAKIQRENKKLYDKESYSSEVFMKYEVNYRDINFLIDGRADEIIKDKGRVIINEIKSTSRSLESIDENYNPLHWYQAKGYGYMYCVENSLDEINIRLTYVNGESYEIKKFEKVFSKEELYREFFGLLDKYVVWATFIKEWNEIKEKSLKKLSFPFGDYRKGQRELAVCVYRTILENKKAFVKAPTGIGKTMSTMFPAVKAMGEGLNEKIFYLTSKGTNGKAAEDALNLLRSKNMKLKSIVVTSKDKICFCDKVSCNPENCSYAKGHYDRVNDAILAILNNEDEFSRKNIEEYARKYEVCPFEFSLDLTLWADLIICDYNYVFDPAVYLRRFFMDNSGNYTFLIDEAHNLVDRARDMYSAQLFKSSVMSLKKSFKDKRDKLYKALNGINKAFIEVRKMKDGDKAFSEKDIPESLIKSVMKFTTICEEWLIRNTQHEAYEDILNFYFDCTSFLRISELYDERFVFIGENVYDDFKIRLFCLDPSEVIKNALKRGKSTVFFSATLMPMSYYKEIYAALPEDYSIALKSPFSDENRCILVGNKISTKYAKREETYDDIVEYINSFVSERVGNYMIFFPSYKYMEEVYKRFTERYKHNTIIQNSNMNESEKKEFIEGFNNKQGEELIGFCVMGGVFSEGIDLKGERLIGAAIVGVGLPQICFERDLIKEYFNKKNNLGYEYAYMYPGMNKVLQAAGRVIRSENDRGGIMLLDERFGNTAYRKLFPEQWFPFTFVKNKYEICESVKKFWN